MRFALKKKGRKERRVEESKDDGTEALVRALRSGNRKQDEKIRKRPRQNQLYF